MDSKDARTLTLQHEGNTKQIYIVEGYSRETLSQTIVSMFFEHTDPRVDYYQVMGVYKLDKNGKDEGPMIPLESVITSASYDFSKTYRPHLWSKPVPEVQSAPPSLPPPPPPSQPQHNSYYGDPWQNDEYFHQYGKLTIHGEMLKDESRTLAYKNAIEMLQGDIKDKVVLDLGTGTGILAMFCAKAGAKRVYAVEASNLADWTELVVSKNNLSHIVKVIKGRIEEIQLPEKVDIIVSEWMGTFLIFESMLESLLWTRDYWLKPDGILLPSQSNIFLSPVTMDAFYTEKIDIWKGMYGIDLSPLIPYAKKCAFEKPIIDKPIKPENVLAPPMKIASFDLRTVPIQEPYQKTIVDFCFKASKTATLHGFAAWFDVVFTGKSTDKSLTLSTSPDFKDTHWHQDLFLFDTPLHVKEGNTIKGTIRYQRNPDLLRHLIIDITFYVEELNEGYSKKFYLWGFDQ